MTTTDMLNRINDAIRDGDQLDLDNLAAHVSDLMMEETQRDAWLVLIETARDSIDGAFR